MRNNHDNEKFPNPPEGKLVFRVEVEAHPDILERFGHELERNLNIDLELVAGFYGTVKVERKWS